MLQGERRPRISLMAAAAGLTKFARVEASVGEAAASREAVPMQRQQEKVLVARQSHVEVGCLLPGWQLLR